VRRPLVLLGAGSLLLLAALDASAALTPVQRCQATKLTAAFGEARARVLCFKSNVAPSKLAACIDNAVRRRDQLFAKADARGGCIATGDSADVGAAVAKLVTDLLTVTPAVTSASRCSATQLGAAASALAKLGQAYVRDVRSADPARLAAALAGAETRFDTTFARALGYGDCLGTGTADQAWAIVAQGGVRLHGKIVPQCGDAVRGAGEACDGTDTGSCAGDCTATCTCADACGDGVVNSGEACDGAGCIAEDPTGCFPPGWADECQCCAAQSPCYVRGFGNVTPVEIPCCTGECNIPGPEAGPNVQVYCTQPPATACPCWTRASLNAAFPPGYFDEEERGGAVCNQPTTSSSVAAADTCTLFMPGTTFVVPRGGAGIIGTTHCVVFSDMDANDDGVCDPSGPGPVALTLTAEQAVSCQTELLASQPYQAECD
jgi:hypothetical protein